MATGNGSSVHTSNPVCHNGPAETNSNKITVLRRSKRHTMCLEERMIWDCIRNNSIYNAVSLSRKILKRKEGPKVWSSILSPLTHFVLSQRQFQLDCLLVGIYIASRYYTKSNLGLDSPEIMMVFMAFMSETSPDIHDRYYGLTDRQLEVVDTILATSTVFHLMQKGHHGRARTFSRYLPPDAWRQIGAFLENPAGAYNAIPETIDRAIRAAWMLRHPASSVSVADVELASSLVTELIRRECVPDRAVLEQLVSFSLSLGIQRAALFLYASRRESLGFPTHAVIKLAATRSHMAQHSPRIHYDVLGSLVRADDLDGALTLAMAMNNRRVFHLLLSLWSSRQPRDWKGVARIVQTMIDTLDCKILHPTQTLAISAMVGATKYRENSADVTVILDTTLKLHWVLLVRLESVSVAAFQQLMQALVHKGMARKAFQIYRHAERYSEPDQLKRLFATDVLFAVLAKGLAQRGDFRSIMHLANAVTQRGVHMTLRFYTSLISGLLHRIKLRRKAKHAVYSNYNSGGGGQHASFVLERVRMAESIVDIVCQNSMFCPPKAYHAIMYGWAILGHTRMAQKYFDKISSLKPPGPHNKGSSISNSSVNQVTWGILMYAHVCASDARGAMLVLGRAKEWFRELSVSGPIPTSVSDTSGDVYKTNHLINMAMTVLVRYRNPSGALALLNNYIERYSDHHHPQGTATASPSDPQFTATPADPVTLNLILRALLLNNQLYRAVAVYDMVHTDFKLAEMPETLRPLLRYYIENSNPSGVMLVAKRMIRLGGVPTFRELLHIVRLSVVEKTPELVVYLYDTLGTMSHPTALRSSCKDLAGSRFMHFLKQTPEMVSFVCWALRDSGRDADALEIESALCEKHPKTAKTAGSTSADSSLLILAPNSATQNKATTERDVRRSCISLYRGLLREISIFPVVELRGKLRYNARFVVELYRDLKPDSPMVGQLLEDGRRQRTWLRQWRCDAEGFKLAKQSSKSVV
ncbi:hypothetical protein LPJ72_004683 [Coemansia sp. Benny D160-2]|nr:hypothetical protein LPJ72_004683 [Coemansia sp. Benny D160-2]